MRNVYRIFGRLDSFLGAQHSFERQSVLEWIGGRCINQSNIRMHFYQFDFHFQLILSGILGLILINFRRVPRQKLREHCFTFMRVNSTMISTVAVLLSVAAFIFAALHLDNITSAHTTCMPDNIFTSPNAACICLFGAKNSTNHLQIQTAEEGEISVGGFEFHYR